MNFNNYKKLDNYEKVAVYLILFSFLMTFIGIFKYSIEKGFSFFEAFSTAFYAVYAFLGGNGIYYENLPFITYLGAITFPIGISLGLVLIFKYRFQRWWNKFLNNNIDILAVGLGKYGYNFFKANKGKKIFFLTDDLDSNYAKRAISEGALVYDINELEELSKKAKEIYLLEDEDLKNIEILKKINSKAEIYIHLKNREFEMFFSPIFEKDNVLKVRPFNVFRNSIIDFFKKNNLEGDINITQKGKKVKILLIGWSDIIKEALWYVLNIGHFYNDEPIEVVVLVDEVDPVEQEIEFLYPRLNEYKTSNNDLNRQYWDVKIIDLQTYYRDYYKKNSFNFTNVIVGFEDVERSIKTAIKFMDLHYEELKKSVIAIYSEELKFERGRIKSFGLLRDILSIDKIKNEKLDTMGKRLAEIYLKNKKKKEENKIEYPWLETVFTYYSNIFASIYNQTINKRTYQKLCKCKEDEIDIEKVKEKYENIFTKIEEKNDKKIKKFLEEEFNAFVKAVSQMNANSTEEKIRIFEKLIELEHIRWNAYHILNGFRYDKEKDKNAKKHNCLITWEKIKKEKEDTIIYDIENVLSGINSKEIK